MAACRFDGERSRSRRSTGSRTARSPSPTGSHWDAGHLFAEILEGLGRASERGLASVGIDGWGVDFAPARPRRRPAGHCRSTTATAHPGRRCPGGRSCPRRRSTPAPASSSCPSTRWTSSWPRGAARRWRPPSTLLLMPDLFRHWLTGERVAEVTNASTTQLLSAGTRDWDAEPSSALGLPAAHLPAGGRPGRARGPVRAELAAAAGLGGAPDVAAGLLARHRLGGGRRARRRAPLRLRVCGTWSLVGLELARPALGAAALEANLSNELGYGGTVRFLKNVMGLWLLQECRRDVAARGRRPRLRGDRAAGRDRGRSHPLDRPRPARVPRARGHARARRVGLPVHRPGAPGRSGGRWPAASWRASPASTATCWSWPSASRGPGPTSCTWWAAARATARSAA